MKQILLLAFISASLMITAACVVFSTEATAKDLEQSQPYTDTGDANSHAVLPNRPLQYQCTVMCSFITGNPRPVQGNVLCGRPRAIADAKKKCTGQGGKVVKSEQPQCDTKGRCS